MAAAKRNDPKKRPVPEVERRPAAPAAVDARRRPPNSPAKSGAKPGARPGAKPGARHDGKPGFKHSGKPDFKHGGKPDFKPGAKPAGKRPPPGRRGPAREGREDRDKDGAPEFIGGPRNEFGTRVARRITCSRCGNVDHVPHAPRDAERALCRACAVEVLNTYEVGTRAKVETRPAVCSICKKPFALPVKVELTDEILCPDCLRGFATWTGGLETPWESRADVVVEQRVGGTLVRRRKK